jgi:putative ABC transport system permease protein
MLLQIRAVSSVGLRSLFRSGLATAIVVVSLAGVTLAVMTLLALSQGYAQSMQPASGESRAVILSAGATSEARSAIAKEEADRLLLERPGMIEAAQAEVSVTVEALAAGRAFKAVLRGLDGFRGVPIGVKVEAGALPSPGRRELIVGSTLARRMPLLKVGEGIEIDASRWTVVGIFSADIPSQESEMIGHGAMISAELGQPPVHQLVRVALAQGVTPDRLDARLSEETRTDYEVIAEPDYYARAAAGFASFLHVLAYPLAAITGFAVSMSILNLCLTMLARRRKELATLYTMGFSRGAIVIAEIVQATTLGLAGGIAATLAAAILLDGQEVSTTLGHASGAASFFRMEFSPSIYVVGLAYGLLLGALSGSVPAIRSMSTVSLESLREAT